MAVKDGVVVFDPEVRLSPGSASELQGVMIKYGKECCCPEAERRDKEGSVRTWDLPPRTRSSLSVQSSGFQPLDGRNVSK